MDRVQKGASLLRRQILNGQILDTRQRLNASQQLFERCDLEEPVVALGYNRLIMLNGLGQSRPPWVCSRDYRTVPGTSP